MNELVEQNESLKEIHCIFNSAEPKIIGIVYRIINEENPNYTWEISHYCRLNNEKDCYIPSVPNRDSLEDTEHELMTYMKRFEKAVDWTENKKF
ncbi:hypothetical protein [Winogradskyella luteola]|uniref:Uncharacterized protein n=1 Tax=Winogradskyella luteola TaxID=2828330 RepID=A0A9X1JPW3_9FLAO|nr:hypothetical protein [Winogradskyella luteola]MBV7268343.1 hypothetical protein [Winogradskyella luteola]